MKPSPDLPTPRSATPFALSNQQAHGQRRHGLSRGLVRREAAGRHEMPDPTLRVATKSDPGRVSYDQRGARAILAESCHVRLLHHSITAYRAAGQDTCPAWRTPSGSGREGPEAHEARWSGAPSTGSSLAEAHRRPRGRAPPRLARRATPGRRCSCRSARRTSSHMALGGSWPGLRKHVGRRLRVNDYSRAGNDSHVRRCASSRCLVAEWGGHLNECLHVLVSELRESETTVLVALEDLDDLGNLLGQVPCMPA